MRLYNYIWKTEFTSYKQYFLVFPSREMQKRLMQNKVYYNTTSFPYPVLKEASHKPLKVAATKKFFPSVFIIDINCFDECFSFHVITTNSIFYTNLSLPKDLVQPSCCWVLSSILKEVYILYPLFPQ